MHPCKELMEGAYRKQTKAKLDCPILVNPRCHPQAQFTVHVDGKLKLIYLSCSKCDRLISVARVRGRMRNTKPTI